MVGTRHLRTRWWWTIPLKAAVAAPVAYLLLWGMNAVNPDMWAMSVLTIAHLAGILFTFFIYLGWNYAGSVDVRPEEARARLLRHLRVKSMVWSDVRGRLVIRLGSYPSVRIILKETGRGTDVFYAPYATPRGRILVVFLALITWLFPVSIILSLGFLRASRRFVSRVLSVLSDTANATVREETKELVETSLFEARRIALETSEAKHSQYHLRLAVLIAAWPAVTLVVGILPWVVSEIGWLDIRIWFFSTVAVTVVVFYYGFLRLRRRFASEVAEFNGWVIRIESQIAAERSEAPFGDDSETSFDVLAQVGRELPSWLSIRRQTEYHFFPWTTALMILLGLSSLVALGTGLTYWPYDPSVNPPAIAAGMIAGTLTLLVHRWIRQRTRSENAKFCELWKNRWNKMMADGESLLGGR